MNRSSTTNSQYFDIVDSLPTTSSDSLPVAMIGTLGTCVILIIGAVFAVFALRCVYENTH